MTVVPCTIKAAAAFIRMHHRHHRPPTGGLFAVAVESEPGAIAGEAGGGSWSRPSRVREDQHPTQRKLKWEASIDSETANV